jgi:glycosyltransferase involved in cell wall biosynthesis
VISIRDVSEYESTRERFGGSVSAEPGEIAKERGNMNLLIIWFLVIDESLHASALLRDLVAMASKNDRVQCMFLSRIGSGIDHGNLRIDVVRVRRVVPIISYIRFCMAAFAWLVKRRQDADVVVLSPDVLPIVLPWFLARKLGCKFRPVFVVRENSPPVGSRFVGHAPMADKLTAYRVLLRYISFHLLSRFCDVVFAISPMHANEIVSQFNVPPQHVQVWPSSFDAEVFNPERNSRDRLRFRRELKIGDRFLLIHHGVLGMQRGLSELVKAVRKVRETRDDVLLLFLGKGRGEQGLRELVRSYKLEGAVLFHGPVHYDEVPRFLAAADAGVVPLPDQPQWRFQAPIKVLEYMAMGKPMILTDIPAHRWLVGNQRNVFFCGQGSPAQIAEAILRCISTKVTVEELDRRAARFSSVAVGESVMQCLRTILDGNREKMLDRNRS